MNEKTHNVWSHGQLTARLAETLALAGIAVKEVDERDTSRICPHCGRTGDALTRCGDTLHYATCGLDAHADLVGAGNILAVATTPAAGFRSVFRPMARPTAHDPGRAWDDDHDCTVTYLKWNGHEWRPTRRGVCEHSRRSRSPNKASANPHVHSRGDGWLRRPWRNLRPLEGGEGVKAVSEVGLPIQGRADVTNGG